MFQLDPATAIDELVADVNSPKIGKQSVIVAALPLVANENEPSYRGPGRLAWQDDDYYYVFED